MYPCLSLLQPVATLQTKDIWVKSRLNEYFSLALICLLNRMQQPLAGLIIRDKPEDHLKPLAQKPLPSKSVSN